jgi:hypothetical protein
MGFSKQQWRQRKQHVSKGKKEYGKWKGREG